MKFIIEYKTWKNETDTLTYKLRDNELVDAWLHCLQSQPPRMNYGFYNLETIDFKRTAIEIANAYYRLYPKFLEKDREINAELLVDKNDNINQDILNKLHMVYHYYQDRIEEYNLTDKDSLNRLQVLNGGIHRLESYSNGSPSYQIMINPTRFSHGMEIPASWYKKYFNEEAENGDLLLGYATIGKDLLEIYNTRDVENLHLITPQKYIYSEFRQMFDVFEKKSKLTTHILRKWCYDHGKKNLSEAELYTFRPKLGKIETDLNFYELKEKCRNFKEPIGWKTKHER